MDGATLVGDERQDLDPPKLLFERLRTVAPGFTWDESKLPFHSSYDNWQVFGTRNAVRSSKQHATNLQSTQTSKRNSSSPFSRRRTEQQAGSEDGSESATSCDEGIEQDNTAVVARISTHALREERAYHICKSLTKSVDPDGNHIARPIDILRLPSQQGDKGPIVVCIFEHPGPNILPKYIDYGPAWYKGRKAGDKHQAFRDEMFTPPEQIPLQTFLEFAVGATECLEVLHHGQRIVHGEIRGDAFHMNVETGRVKLINFGSGLRTFEHGLTSTGWSTLSKEVGAKTKLSYMSPEQTGRMPAEPDSRTDIYSLGILFWTLLAQQPAFDGETPMDIIQGVLGRRVPTVSSIRLDIPDVVGKIIQKMTAKAIGDRYHSASGLRYDLLEVQKLLGDGNSAALKDWQIATKDVSSFFILPTTMIGRRGEHDEIVKIIDKVSRRHLAAQRQDIHSLSSGSSLSNPEDFEAALVGLMADGGDLSISSEGDNTSSADRSSSITPGTGSRDARGIADSNSDHFQSSAQSQLNSLGSHESVRSNASRSGSNLKPWEKKSSLSMEARSGVESMADGQRSTSDGAGSLTSQRNTHKFRRKGRCEVVSIAGAAGLGKSCLVQSVQVEARRRGYFASSKFDQTKKTPFGPVLKILSTLFKQVFSESDTDTPFHQLLKQYVRPAWPMLHRVLGLPEFLLGPNISPQKRASQAYNKSIQQGMGQRASSSASSRRNSTYTHSVALGVQSSQDFLRAGSSTKSTRLLNTFLDVLRVFTQHKFICLCLDDLQFADDESLDLITQIVAARMKLVLMVTYRPDEILPARIKPILEPPNTEGIKYIKAGGVGITRIELRPLSEDDIVQYVALALCRPMHEIIPLAAVIQSKTAGNPFYMREMLDTCHRKQCIWYDYGDSVWRYDLDRIFKQFQTADYHDTLDHKFVDNRLNELPASSRSILAWASLLGTSFSFELVQRLINGEFYYEDDTSSGELDPPHSASRSEQDAIGGLQAAIQAYIIVPTQDDDRFRFAHDRYIQAAKTLRDGKTAKMHFIIAQTLNKYYVSDERYRNITASHISESIRVINERVMHRQSFRKVLFDCAQLAAESGARPTAAKYYANCFALLQPSPWVDDGAADCYYDETLALHIRASECYLYMGQYEEAKRLISIVFSNARTAVDQAPCWVLQSRIYSQEGDSGAAFHSLKHCLKALNIEFDNEPSFDKCDAEFERLSLKIQSLDRHELINRSMTTDSNLGAVGAVLVETISAAFWSNSLTFYQMSLVMINTHVCHGAFPQAGMAYLHLAMISIARFNMIKFASELGNISLELMDRWRDPYTMGRGNTVYSMFVGHVQYPLHTSMGQLEGTLEYTIQAGDRISTILNFGLVALLKFFASDHLSDLESFCTYGCEEVPNWQHDTRGGTMLISVRQLSRSLQGKTPIENALEIMSDESFNSELYCAWLTDSPKNNERPIVLYRSLEIVPLFLYGHYSRAVEVGSLCLEKVEFLWSIRNSRLVMFFQGLSLAGQLWNRLHDPRRTLNTLTSPTKERSEGESEFTEEELSQEIIEVKKQVKYFKKKIEDWQLVTDVNYFAWSKLLAAQLAEMEDEHSQALRFYEEVLDHASAQNFVFEEALGNYLLAGFFLRQGSRRPAKAALREAIMLYRQFGATGVAKYIEDLHSLLLQGPTRNLRTAEVGVQTDFAGDSAPVQYQTLEGDENEDRRQTHASITETKGDRIDAWQGGSARPEVGGGLPALDMLDLTSILESSQVISSVLQIDELLKTMCEIILQNCGGLAELAAIVVEEDDPVGWSIAASGDPDKGAEAHIPGLPVQESSLVAENVIIYCTRFRETVFLPNLIHDERFSNVSERWSDQHSLGRAVIAIPISHGSKPLLGVLYLEGQPNVFTDRNLTVLQLLVNQIGISYSNALTLKAIEKVSASNISMVDMQKTALAKSIEAEAKAKTAEAEALRNVQLAEEAAKAKSIFLANVSHELRTPLNGVIGNSELLKDSDLRKDQAEMADSIRVSADLLLTVINDILDFSKMEADKMKLFIVAFNADEMIREVIRSVSYSNRDKNSAKNVEIIQDINLPKSLIFGDPVRLHQVLGNLIGNSLKFTEKGSITIGAKTNWETKEAVQLTFWVKDTGIGIPPNKLANLFKPFSQADASTARKYGGSGLGLSICRSLIESMMGGKIELESVEDVGTTAWFTVNFSKADPEASAGDIQDDMKQNNVVKEADTNQQEERYAIPTTDFSDIPREELRICIAEDNPINQRIAIQFMQKLGFKHVDAYVNGLEAVEGLRRKAMDGQPYHIILMDVQMPVMDGYEATKLLRKDPIEAVRTILVIAMTASAIQGDREKCLESGMNDYLAKPVRSGILKRKLDQYLLQTPLPISNLQADAKHIANDVLKEANGALTPIFDSSGTATPKAPQDVRITSGIGFMNGRGSPLKISETMIAEEDVPQEEFSSSEKMLSPKSTPRVSRSTAVGSGSENAPPNANRRSNSVVRVESSTSNKRLAKGKEKEKK